MRPDIHHMVRELTEPVVHHEPLLDGTHWPVTALALLDQLAQPVPPSSSIDSGRPGYQSNVVVRIEAIDALVEIDREASGWIRRLGHDDPPGCKACVSLLHGLHALQPEHVKRQIEDDVWHWWQWARVLTGWDTPTFRPDNTCPRCDQRGGLRIRLEERLATCVKCRATWEPGTIGLLGAHIQRENDQRTRRDAAHPDPSRDAPVEHCA